MCPVLSENTFKVKISTYSENVYIKLTAKICSIFVADFFSPIIVVLNSEGSRLTKEEGFKKDLKYHYCFCLYA